MLQHLPPQRHLVVPPLQAFIGGAGAYPLLYQRHIELNPGQAAQAGGGGFGFPTALGVVTWNIGLAT